MEEAGADAIELNIYSIATNPAVSGAEVEQGYIDLVRQLKRTLRIPLAVKLSPFFSAPANMGVRLDESRADGSCCSTASINLILTSINWK